MLNPVDRLPEKLLGYDSFFFSHVRATSTSHESVAQSVFLWILIISQSPNWVLCVGVEFAAHRDFILRPGTGIPKQKRMELMGMSYGYGSIPIINTIFSGMNIHKSQLFWCELQGYKVLTHCHIFGYDGTLKKNHSPRWRSTMTSWPVRWKIWRQWTPRPQKKTAGRPPIAMLKKTPEIYPSESINVDWETTSYLVVMLFGHTRYIFAGWDHITVHIGTSWNISGWWLTYPSEKYEGKLGWLFPIYGKNKSNVPNHQPDLHWLMQPALYFYRILEINWFILPTAVEKNSPFSQGEKKNFDELWQLWSLCWMINKWLTLQRT